MRALTICPPFPALILLPESDPHHKRVENRDWLTDYRGPLIIHSGRSKKWLKTYDPVVVARLEHHYGFAVGVCELTDCYGVSLDPGPNPFHDPRAIIKYPWLRLHRHVSGPACFVLQNVVPFAKPIPWRGQQGFFDIPENAIANYLGRKPSELLAAVRKSHDQQANQ